MPLSTPTDRELLHQRIVNCRGYRRADGLWDIEGRVTDTKSYGFDNDHRGYMAPGDLIHDMWIRLTVDEVLMIHGAEAASDATPFEICPAIAPAFAQLVGLQIKPGWMAEARRRIGGVHGCTHIFELLGPVATTAFQTVFPTREKTAAAQTERRKPDHLDTCHALTSDGPVVKRHWPEFYTGG